MRKSEPANMAPLNIGWLDESREFPTGKCPDGLLDALLEAIVERRINQTRSCHPCYLCRRDWIRVENPFDPKGKSLPGSAEIRVIGVSGVLYAAPTLIAHYVAEHDYLPPSDFRAGLILFN